jgi:hypothetical protein
LQSRIEQPHRAKTAHKTTARTPTPVLLASAAHAIERPYAALNPPPMVETRKFQSVKRAETQLYMNMSFPLMKNFPENISNKI